MWVNLSFSLRWVIRKFIHMVGSPKTPSVFSFGLFVTSGHRTVHPPEKLRKPTTFANPNFVVHVQTLLPHAGRWSTYNNTVDDCRCEQDTHTYSCTTNYLRNTSTHTYIVTHVHAHMRCALARGGKGKHAPTKHEHPKSLHATRPRLPHFCQFP